MGTIQHTYLSFNSFTEDGSLAPLHFPDQNQDSMRSTLGARLTHECKFAGMIVRPEVRAAWQHEYNDRAYDIDARFIDCPDNFTVWGPRIGRDSALISAGAALLWNDRVSTYVYYDGVFGRSNYDSNNVSGGVRISF